MFKKITKNLIILGAIIFSFALTNSVYATYAFSNDRVDYQENLDGYYGGDLGYSRYNYYQQAGYPDYSYNQGTSQYGYNTQTGYRAQTGTPVINNYYYNTTAPKTTTSTTSSTTPKLNLNTVSTSTQKTTTDTSNTTTNRNVTSNVNGTSNSNTGYYNNALGASAYNSFGSSAASSQGARSFMPSTIWGWMFVIILILAIVILSRLIARKTAENKKA